MNDIVDMELNEIQQQCERLWGCTRATFKTKSVLRNNYEQLYIYGLTFIKRLHTGDDIVDVDSCDELSFHNAKIGIKHWTG